MRRRIDGHPGSALATPGLVALALALLALGCEGEEPAEEQAAVDSAPCAPVCGADRCGQEDGCGGRCACASDATCLSCPLRLVRVGDGGPAGTVTLAVESSAVAGAPLPRIAELAVAADRPVELLQVAVGPSLASAGKRLHRFTDTDLPFRRDPDGSFRLLVFSARGHAAVPPGRWLTLRFAVAAEDTAHVDFSLVRRPDTLAPAAADVALQATRYDKPLRVSATVGR